MNTLTREAHKLREHLRAEAQRIETMREGPARQRALAEYVDQCCALAKLEKKRTE